MKKIVIRVCVFAFSSYLSIATQAAILTFDGNICEGMVACTNGAPISQTYGDTADVDVIYDSQAGGLPTTMGFWASDYSDLTNVAFGGGSSAAEIFLNPITNASVVLKGFALGAWPNSDRPSQWTILDGLGNLLMQSGPITILGAAATVVEVDLVSSSGFRIQFGPDAFNVGIDNVNFESTPVPLPAAIWVMLPALAISIRRRRG